MMVQRLVGLTDELLGHCLVVLKVLKWAWNLAPTMEMS